MNESLKKLQDFLESLAQYYADEERYCDPSEEDDSRFYRSIGGGEAVEKIQKFVNDLPLTRTTEPREQLWEIVENEETTWYDHLTWTWRWKPRKGLEMSVPHVPNGIVDGCHCTYCMYLVFHGEVKAAELA